jgi:uncharacterized RDD family membrane protein YckC
MARRISEALRDYLVVHEDATLRSLPGAEPGSGPRTRSDAPAPASVDYVDAAMQFDIEERIGRGGMGLVYRAWDRVLRRRVALKVLPDSGDEAAGDHERILQEARAQARLSSPHVVHVYEVGRTRHPENAALEASFFAMELCEGGTLDDILERGEKLEPERACELLRAVARGLADALAHGIVHRDIKPSNLLLDELGRVHIADFGVARCLADGRLTVTRSGRLVGTPIYMAPEQARGEATDHRADIYSLGCTFYHLLAGRPPFDGSNPIRILQGHLREQPPPLAKVAPAVPRPLARMLERMLEKDPERRFQSYEELIAALDSAARPVRYAGIGLRAAAASADFAIAVAAIVALGWRGLLLHLALVTALHATRGQSVGKWLMGIQVRSIEGTELGAWRALARTASSVWLPMLVGITLIASAKTDGLLELVEQLKSQDVHGFSRTLMGLALGHSFFTALYAIGLAVALFNPQKRAAHDLIAGSEVVYRNG